MKKLIIILLVISSSCIAQNKYNLVATIEVESDFFTTDNQSNIYIVKGNGLSKFDKTGKMLYKYSNKNFGNISFVDASNMLRILVFYKDFMQVVFLDNTLSANGDPISLESIGYQQAKLACTANNSGMWIFNQQNFELVRLDQNLIIAQETGNLNAILNTNLQADLLMEFNNKVYLNSPPAGILIFDVYGTYYKTIPVKGAPSFQPIGDWVYYISNKKVNAYNIKTIEEKEFKMPLSNFQSFRLEMGTLMLRTPKAIFLYSSE